MDTPFIDFTTIDSCFTASKKAFISEGNDIFEREHLFLTLSNKEYMHLLGSLDIEQHTMAHYKQFCRHAISKLNSYKSQDKVKYKGDYESLVVKREHNDAVVETENECRVLDYEENHKTVHTNAYRYISRELYENKYFNLVSLLLLIVNTGGVCFYCGCILDFEPANSFLVCGVERSCKFNIIKTTTSGSTEKYSLHSSKNSDKWSLERINNTLGHYQSNCVIACIKCNISRRQKNHQHFKFTKKLVIEKKNNGLL